MCPGKTTGWWFKYTSGSSATSPVAEWKFESDPGFKNTLVTVNAPTVEGTVPVQPLVPSLYSNGLGLP